MEHIIIIGGGGTGGALAHDLTLRGFKVTLLEKGEPLSGTTGRHHGLLHSGARYVTHDPEAAKKCIQENRILRRIAPQALEQNDGLFVALTDADMAYRSSFLKGCRACHIPAAELPVTKALSIEPALNPDIKTAVQVPDATMDAWRLPMHFLATAKSNGADIRPFSEVIEIYHTAGAVSGVRVFDYARHREYDLGGDLIINSGGPWAGKIAALCGLDLPVQPGPGVMVSIAERVTNMVINRLHPAGDGDIIVPQRRLTVLGTSVWLEEEPDAVTMPSDHAEMIIMLCAKLVPVVKEVPVHSVWSASRPLIADGAAENPQVISRTFGCYDHGKIDNLEGFLSVIGGKATTQRAMAEKTADLICRKTGRDISCRTRDTKLLHYRLFYK